MHIFAPAKLNLYLHITGRRTDNYHLLDSLFVFTDFGDELTFTPASEFKLLISGDFGQNLITTEDNIITRTVKLLAKHTNNKPDFHIELIKNIPVGAGLGGGSADAAACLKALSKMWNIDDNSLIQEIALELGADVPSCLNSTPIFVNGIGEKISPAPSIPDCTILLINPGLHISTPDVFKKFNPDFSLPLQKDLLPTSSLKEFCEFLNQETRNDLTTTAISIEPDISNIINTMTIQEGCYLSRMSGSGATCFGIFETMEQAEQAEKNMLHHHFWWAIKTKLKNK